jgi:uncharacterized protein YlaI
MGMKNNIRTREQWELAIKASRSVAETLKLLGLHVSGGNYRGFHINVSRYGIDTSHFLGMGWNKGHSINVARPLSEILVENSTYQSTDSLRKRLLKEGIKKYICESCELTQWLGKPIPLELEHVNGIRSDNRGINLKLLCPNCHAQTATYRGKNIGKSRPKGKLVVSPAKQKKFKLCSCGEKLGDIRGKQCRKCYDDSRAI